MYAFFVLGIVPGTNIQISFELWLQIVTEFLAGVIICWTALHIYRFFVLTNQLLTPMRVQLHATQLHQRAQ